MVFLYFYFVWILAAKIDMRYKTLIRVIFSKLLFIWNVAASLILAGLELPQKWKHLF